MSDKNSAEINKLQEDINQLLSLNSEFVNQENSAVVYQKLVNTIQHFCKCDAAFLFCIDEDFISLKYCNVKSQNFEKTGTDAETLFPITFIPEVKNNKLLTPVEKCALNKELIKIDGTPSPSEWDLTNLKNVEAKLNYAAGSLICLPIVSRENEVIAVVELINAMDEKGNFIYFNTKCTQIINDLCANLALFLENKKIQKYNSTLLESFIGVLSKIIDYKSQYTAIHCQRVPIITRMITSALVADDGPIFKNFNLNEDDWYNIHVASWLHDCGKVATPDYILEKATKLETVFNRIHEIRNRFEILRRDAHIEYLKNRLIGKKDKDLLQEDFVNTVKELEDDFEHVAKCNTGDIALTEEDVNRLNTISKKSFTRYFSRIKGLSWAELNNIENKELFDNPAEEYLLQNRKEQKYNNFNLGEIYNLKTDKGTINPEERHKINEHINITIDILKTIAFPNRLATVVEFAGGHHERIDGKGYPYGLKGAEMPIPAKVIAIADIFEALTSIDRPYKKPKKLSQVLEIMQEMKNTGHIDPDIYEVFIKSKTYLEYAKQYLNQEQIDEFNEEAYL